MTDHDPIDTMLADLRTDVPEMTDRAFAAGRARVQALIAPTPVPTTPLAEPRVVPLARRRLLRSPPRRLVTAAAAVVALAAGGVAIQTIQFGDNPPIATAAAESLNSAADKITPTDEPVAPGQYRYRGTHQWASHTFNDIDHDDTLVRLEEAYRDSWAPADPTGDWLLRETSTGNYKWLAGNDEEAAARGMEPVRKQTDEWRLPCGLWPSPDMTDPCSRPGDWSRPTPEFLDSLPTDPQQLYQRLRADEWTTNPYLGFHMLSTVAQGLDTGLYPAKIRANVYRAIALIPGLRIVDGQANLDGKVGTAYGLSTNNQRLELIIDPANGEYIGSRMISEADGSVLLSTAVTIGVVNKLGEKPAG